MKAKYDVYVQKDLQEYFDKEPNKSGLINDLLRAHFEKVAKKIDEFGQVGIRTSIKTEGLTTTVTPNAIDVAKFKKKVGIIKTPKQAAKVTKKISETKENLCKIHSIPLDNRGKCLQKGCKYA